MKKTFFLSVFYILLFTCVQAQNWTQIGLDIDGENAADNTGHAVSLSADGTIVAIGEPYNDDNGTDAGHVRVYENSALNIAGMDTTGINIYPNPSTGIFYIGNPHAYDITITDITGKIVYHAVNKINQKVNLTRNGVYIINLTSDTNSFSYKIIVK